MPIAASGHRTPHGNHFMIQTVVGGTYILFIFRSTVLCCAGLAACCRMSSLVSTTSSWLLQWFSCAAFILIEISKMSSMSLLMVEYKHSLYFVTPVNAQSSTHYISFTNTVACHWFVFNCGSLNITLSSTTCTSLLVSPGLQVQHIHHFNYGYCAYLSLVLFIISDATIGTKLMDFHSFHFPFQNCMDVSIRTFSFLFALMSFIWYCWAGNIKLNQSVL